MTSAGGRATGATTVLATKAGLTSTAGPGIVSESTGGNRFKSLPLANGWPTASAKAPSWGIGQ